MEMREAIIQQYPDEEFMFADGLDEAIIGVDIDSFNSEPRIIYSVDKCITILERDMSDTEAIEYFNYNVSGAYMGKKTPIWMNTPIL